jgi:hypothetical protein
VPFAYACLVVARLPTKRVRAALLAFVLVVLEVALLGWHGSPSDDVSSGEPGDAAEPVSGLTRPKGGRREFLSPVAWPRCDTSCALGNEPFHLETDYLFPELQRRIDHYVTSCPDGGSALDLESDREVTVRRPGFKWQGRTGEFRVPLTPGQSFVVEDGADRYRIRCLPNNFPGWDFERLEDPSHKFYSAAYGRSNDNEDEHLNPFVVIFDEHGVPVWWRDEDQPTLGGQVVEYRGKPYVYWRKEGPRQQSFLEDFHQLHTLRGRLAYQFESPRLTTDGHEFNLRKNGDVWLISYVPRAGTDFSDIGGPESAWSAEAIVEQVRDGKTIWRWSTRRTIHSYEAARNLDGQFDNKDDGTFQDPFDRVHMNSVEPAGDRVIVSLRNTDGVYGIDRASGEIAWKLGGEKTPESLEVIGDPYDYPSGSQHDARVLPDGTISVFDNRTGLDQPPRVTRWRIDEDEMTATLVESYDDPFAPGSAATGSARYSPDGSLFVYWGDSYLMTEFDPEGEIAFRIAIEGMAYRAYPVPDGLYGYRDFDRSMDAESG